MAVPDISVVIPTYNRAGLLPAALDSVFAQTFPGGIEVVVVDDGSKDNTAEVIRPYLDRGGRVTVRYLPRANAGVCATRNFGLTQCNGELVAFLDSDDEWEPGKLARQAALLSGGVGVVHTDFRYIDPAGRFTDAGPQRPGNPTRGRCLGPLLAEDRVIFSSVLARRELIDAAAAAEPHGDPFDRQWANGQDYDLLLRLARHTAFGYVAEPLTRYRMHDTQNAMANLPRVFGYHCRVQMAFAARWGRAEGLPADAGVAAAREFLYRRADSLYWQRRTHTVVDLCRLADILGLADERFAALADKARRPLWLFRVKDSVDRLRIRADKGRSRSGEPPRADHPGQVNRREPTTFAKGCEPVDELAPRHGR
ncbi:MAG: glycosyltransferase family 2 protein [Gemmataceae bacterium]